MLKFSVRLFNQEDLNKEINNKNLISRQSLSAIITFNDGEVEDSIDVFINDLYKQLIDWRKNISNNGFVNFIFMDSVDFQLLFSFKQIDNKFFIESPEYNWCLTKNDIIDFSDTCLQTIKDFYISFGQDGVDYLERINQLD